MGDFHGIRCDRCGTIFEGDTDPVRSDALQIYSRASLGILEGPVDGKRSENQQTLCQGYRDLCGYCEEVISGKFKGILSPPREMLKAEFEERMTKTGYAN